MKKRIYFDYNATTPVHPEVTEAMGKALTECWGNPSSVHQEGQRSRAALETARRRVADFLLASPQEIYFTSGGTEANNLALRSILGWEKGDRIPEVITNPVEHPCVMKPLQTLASQGKINLRTIPIEPSGGLNLNEFRSMLTPQTRLVTCMLVNNELGSLYPLEQIVTICREVSPRIFIHCDAIQGVGRLPVQPRDLGVSSLSLSGHKFYGPKGVGALWVEDDTWLRPLILGGAQEGGMRSGTENLPGIIGLGKACEIAHREMRRWEEELAPLRGFLEEQIRGRIADCRINACESERIYSTTNVYFRGVPGDLLHQGLDLAGFAVATGSACSSGTVSGSPILRALGQNDAESNQAIRISLGRDTLKSQVADLVDAIQSVVERIRQTL